MNNRVWTRMIAKYLSCTIFFIMCGAVGPALADDVYWAGGNGAWSDSDGWEDINGNLHTPPGNGDNAFLINPGTVTYNVSSVNLSQLNIDWGTSLQQSANQLVSDWNEIGNSSTGSYYQSGSSIHTVNNDLNFGQNPGGNGYYNLSGGLLDVKRYEHLGVSGVGTFVQTGGTHLTGGYLAMSTGDASAQASYSLSGSGSSLKVGTWEGVGWGGKATFEQTGGSHEVGTNLYLGYDAAAEGTYKLKGATSTLTVHGWEQIGRNGSGTFIQEGGTHTVDGNLWIARNAGSTGVYQLINGTLDVKGEIINQGTFYHSQGTHTVAGTFNVGTASGSGAAYNFDGGTINAKSGFSNNGAFNQTNGLNTVSGTFTNASAVGNTGTYNLGGGTFNANSGMTNNGSFNFTNGQLGIATTSTLTNNGNFNITGLGGGGGGPTSVLQNGWGATGTAIQTSQVPVQQMTWTGNGPSAGASIVNNGTWTVNNATAVYNLTPSAQVSLDYELASPKSFYNYGAYISDPSMSVFWDLIVGNTGYLQGGAGDEFLILGNFQNESTQTGFWDTKKSLLGFVGDSGSAHQYTLGETASGFDWDVLYLSSGNGLSVAGTFLNGLQFGEIVLDDGLAQLGSITSSQNIYYNVLRDRSGNIFNPVNYSLQGGGSLIYGSKPVTVPEPSTLSLLSIGLFILQRLRKKTAGKV